MGGIGSRGYLSDVLIFNVTSKECRKVDAGKAELKFCSNTNQTALVGNKIVALVNFYKTPCLIKWKIGQKTTTVLKSYGLPGKLHPKIFLNDTKERITR